MCMNKLLKACVLVVLGALSAFSPNTSAGDSEPIIHAVKNFGFKLTAPGSWKPSESDTASTRLKLSVDASIPNAAVFIVSAVLDPPQNEKDLPFAVKEFRDRWAKDMPDYVFDKNQDTTIAGKKAVKITFLDKVKGSETKGFFIITARNNKLYSLSFIATPSIYDDKLPDVQKVVESFKWTD